VPLFSLLTENPAASVSSHIPANSVPSALLPPLLLSSGRPCRCSGHPAPLAGPDRSGKPTKLGLETD
jgi:hypothetical protein